MKLVDMATEVQAKAEKLITENDQLRNTNRELELTVTMLKADNDSLRLYTQRLRTERDQFLRVANSIITSCGEAKKIFNDSLEKAHVQISNFKAEEAPAFSEEDAQRLKIVTEGLVRINEPLPETQQQPVKRKLPPDFINRLHADLTSRSNA